MILLPDTTAEQAERALERIRRKVATLRLVGVRPRPFPVTISVGIASAARGDDRRTLFAAADGVLYDAKRSGRDRVVRLSGVTQTRAPGSSPLDALFGPPPSARPTPSPEDAMRRLRRGRAAFPAGRRHRRRRIGFRSAPDLQPDPPLGTGTRRRAAAGPGARAAPCRHGRSSAAAGPAPSSPTSSGAPAAAPSRSSPWCARPAASTPTVRRWCCAPRPRRSSRWPASTTRTRPWTPPRWPPPSARCPSRVGRVRVLCAGGGDTPVAAEAAFVARVTGTEVVRVDDVGGSRIRAPARRRHAARRRRLPGGRRRPGRLARHDDRRDDRRPGGRGAHLDRPAQRVRRPRRADDDAELGRAGRRRQQHRQRLLAPASSPRRVARRSASRS